MRFEWDERKARSNAAKHGVTFEQAVTAFDAEMRWMADDLKHSKSNEQREWLIGKSDGGLLLVSFVQKESGSAIRIISARKAGRRDRRRYETAKHRRDELPVAPRPPGDA